MPQPRPSRIRTTEFRSLFRMIVRATVASCCVAACSTETQLGGTDDASVPPDGDAALPPNGDAALPPDGDAALPPDAGDRYAYLECGTGFLPKLPAPLQTTPSAESVAIYRSAYGLSAEFGPALCADADDACLDAVQAALKAAPCSEDPALCSGLALHKQGDTLSRIQSREELLAFFGEIDSVAEAVLLAAFDGRILQCARPRALETMPLQGTGIYQDAEGFHIQSEYDNCGERAQRERYTVAADGSLRDDGTEDLGPTICAIGRRPEGVCGAHPAPGRRETAGFLAEVAELEAASVLAFRKIADELEALSAPAELIAASQAALCDEVRHADVMARMARRFGGTPQHPEVPESPLRSAYALACDNASEGCVRETFGALLASYQAEHAQDAALREAFQTLAEDETRHAQLSWEIAAWLEPKLSEQERAQLAQVRMTAIETLRGELDLGLSAEARSALGLPDHAQAAKLFGSLRETLWS